MNTVLTNKTNTLILTGDDFGLVNVYNYPEPAISESRSFAGHSEHVPRLVMSKDNQRVYSIGGMDRAIIQWKVKSTDQ